MGRNGLFYVSGGIKNSQYQFDDTLDVYNVRADKWTCVQIGKMESDLSAVAAKQLSSGESAEAAFHTAHTGLARASHHFFSLPTQPVVVLHA